MQNFYTHVRKIVDSQITKKNFLKNKKDSSMLTKEDLIIQKKLIKLIQQFFPDIKQFICEENFDLKKFKNIDFNKPFAIIDPIDGTENYFAGTSMFGTLISLNYDLSKKIDLIYIPKEKLMINRENIFTKFNTANKNNKISILSTKCLSEGFKGSKHRIFGSSAYSFYKFISGEANEYIYCKGTKIWDCFTGLRLSSLLNCKIQLEPKNWFINPTFKTELKLKWA